MTKVEAIWKISKARKPEDIFPDGVPAAEIYRKLAKLCHPDTVTDNLMKAQATVAFSKLSELYSKLNGDGTPTAPKPVVGDWTIESPLAKGDIADLYLVSGKGQSAVLKVARSAKDNDLMDREHQALKLIHTYDPATGDSAQFSRYFPSILSRFEVSGRKAHVLPYIDGGFTLTELRKAFNHAIPMRHIVWMMNRGLTALGWAHRREAIHGSLTSDHLIYLPDCHGLMVVDWTCSISADGLPFIIDRWKHDYPPESKKKLITPQSDIYMLACALMPAAERPVPKRFTAIFEWMVQPSVHSRPNDAWLVQAKWKEAAKAEYGPPAFIPLVIPKH